MKIELEKILETLNLYELQRDIVIKPMSDQYKKFQKTTLIDNGKTKNIMISGSGIMENYISKFDVYYVKNDKVIIKPKLIREFLDQ